MKLKLTTLGSMGWIPTRNRHACCYCLEYGDSDTLIVFDAGTGLARFDEPRGREILQRYSKVLLILSHYHMDHVSGLVYLPFFFKEKTLHIAAPGRDIYGRGVEEILGGIMTPPYFGRLTDILPDLEIHDLGAGKHTISGVSFETVPQQHAEPSLGIKIGGNVCYLTDTVCSGVTAEFVSGSRLMLHDSWMDSNDYNEMKEAGKRNGEEPGALKSHSAVHRVAEIAAGAKVESLVLIHLNPAYDETRLKGMEREARALFPNSQLARDGVSHSLSFD
ncbi:MAG: MBL fold metallo-hydrolase [bacterium]|nr:MBL fold metallo-hydrolase [bacterium]